MRGRQQCVPFRPLGQRSRAPACALRAFFTNQNFLLRSETSPQQRSNKSLANQNVSYEFFKTVQYNLYCVFENTLLM